MVRKVTTGKVDMFWRSGSTMYAARTRSWGSLILESRYFYAFHYCVVDIDIYALVLTKHFFNIFLKFWSICFRISRKYRIHVSSLLVIILCGSLLQQSLNLSSRLFNVLRNSEWNVPYLMKCCAYFRYPSQLKLMY